MQLAQLQFLPAKRCGRSDLSPAAGRRANALNMIMLLWYGSSDHRRIVDAAQHLSLARKANGLPDPTHPCESLLSKPKISFPGATGNFAQSAKTDSAMK
jgi:hypothetical protein